MRIKRAVDHRLKLMRVLYFAAPGQPLLRFLGAEPGGITQLSSGRRVPCTSIKTL